MFVIVDWYRSLRGNKIYTWEVGTCQPSKTFITYITLMYMYSYTDIAFSLSIPGQNLIYR